MTNNSERDEGQGKIGSNNLYRNLVSKKFEREECLPPLQHYLSLMSIWSASVSSCRETGRSSSSTRPSPRSRNTSIDRCSSSLKSADAARRTRAGSFISTSTVSPSDVPACSLHVDPWVGYRLIQVLYYLNRDQDLTQFHREILVREL